MFYVVVLGELLYIMIHSCNFVSRQHHGSVLIPTTNSRVQGSFGLKNI